MVWPARRAVAHPDYPRRPPPRLPARRGGRGRGSDERLASRTNPYPAARHRRRSARTAVGRRADPRGQEHNNRHAIVPGEVRLAGLVLSPSQRLTLTLIEFRFSMLPATSIERNSTVYIPLSIRTRVVPVFQCKPLSKLYSVRATPDRLSDAAKKTTTLNPLIVWVFAVVTGAVESIFTVVRIGVSTLPARSVERAKTDRKSTRLNS